MKRIGELKLDREAVKIMDGDAAFFICITMLIVLCAGDPDLLDGLIKLTNGCPKP